MARPDKVRRDRGFRIGTKQTYILCIHCAHDVDELVLVYGRTTMKKMSSNTIRLHGSRAVTEPIYTENLVRRCVYNSVGYLFLLSRLKWCATNVLCS
jgi:hypothetical protein